MRQRSFSILLAATIAGVAAAADVSSPVTGWVFDAEAKAVRPISGLPGASVLGEALDLGYDLAFAAIAPEQDYLITVARDNTVRMVRTASRAGVAWETLHGAPQQVVFSPRGRSVLLIHRAAIDVYTGLLDQPLLARTLDRAGLGSLSAMAVSDDGIAVLASAEGRMYAAGESAEWKAIESAGPFAFVPNSRDAVVAGPDGTIRMLSDVTRGGENQEIARVDGQGTPTRVIFAASGRIVVTTNRSVSVIDQATGGRTALSCDCASPSLTRMGNVIRLNDVSDAPLWLLDGTGEEPRLVFVPARVSRRPVPPHVEQETR